jgi:glycerate kinase
VTVALGRVLACPDKFKGTATAGEVAAAIACGARRAGLDVVERPLSDGGEGLLEVFGGGNRQTSVTGPLGQPVVAEWRLSESEAVIEMAQAAGLVLAGGPSRNDPAGATTRGVGELILAAVEVGAGRIVVGCGGSATTDGGVGAVEVIGSPDRLDGARVVVACDVGVRFVEAARLFGPQKGASPEDIVRLTERLEGLARRYEAEYGRAVADVPGSGAAGGLAGGLAALGAELVPGMELVAELTDLDDLIAQAGVVVTGEGRLDLGSFSGKVAGDVASRARGRTMACVCGASDAEGRRLGESCGLQVLDLSEMYGAQAALTDTSRLISAAVAEWLGSL